MQARSVARDFSCVQTMVMLKWKCGVDLKVFIKTVLVMKGVGPSVFPSNILQIVCMSKALSFV